ncbi:MAG: histidine kinase N-terminal 7TM domain-containing protein [Phormidesmis sp.]
MPVYFLVAILPAIAAFTSGSVALYAWQRREINGARAFSLCTASVFIWCFFSVFESLSLGEGARITFGKAQYLGITAFPVFWLIFTLRYAYHDDWLSRRVLVALGIIPGASLCLAYTDRWHGWVWQSASVQLEPFPALLIKHGWWFDYVLIPQCYLLLLAGCGVLLAASFSGSRLYRKQTLILLGAALAPFVCNVLYVVSGVTFYGLDLTPVGFGVAGALIHVGLFRAKFLDIAPISYKTVFLNTADAVVLLDIHHRIVDLNPSAIAEGQIWVKAQGAVGAVGHSFEQVFPNYSALLKDARQTAELTERVTLLEPFDKADSGQGRPIFREVKVRSLLSPGGRRVGWVVIIRDITLEQQQQAQLEQLAYIDSLTGLFNRRQLELKAAEAFAPYPGQSVFSMAPSALLYIDLNRFKPINDQYGHEVGDSVLKHFAQCLKRSVRQGDIVVRLGGDEFAALLCDADSVVAMEVRSRLIKILNQEITLAGHRFTLSASIGIAYYPADGVTLQEILRQADEDMYREKRLVEDV